VAGHAIMMQAVFGISTAIEYGEIMKLEWNESKRTVPSGMELEL
jgi:hypothetical protein